MSIEVETQIDESDLENFVDRVIDGRDLIGEDGVLPVIDGLLNDFILNSTCMTARRFEKVVCEIVDSLPAATVAGPTTEAIADMVADEVQRALARVGSTLADTLRSAR